MPIEQAIHARLSGTPAITAVVPAANIFPSFRDDPTPSICYELSLDDVEGTYELTGPLVYDLAVLVVHDRLPDAAVIADLVIDALDRQAWESDGFRVIGCCLRDRETSYPEKSSKNSRLGVVELRFDFTVDGATAAATP